jgi:hypothetical protein
MGCVCCATYQIQYLTGSEAIAYTTLRISALQMQCYAMIRKNRCSCMQYILLQQSMMKIMNRWYWDEAVKQSNTNRQRITYTMQSVWYAEQDWYCSDAIDAEYFQINHVHRMHKLSFADYEGICTMLNSNVNNIQWNEIKRTQCTNAITMLKRWVV